jgi:hypothetical protein
MAVNKSPLTSFGLTNQAGQTINPNLGARDCPGNSGAHPQSEQNTELYRSYVVEQDAHGVLRHRGKWLRQAACFFRNAELNFHAAQLASLFLMYGLVGGTPRGLEPRYRVGSLVSGALLCRAYEAYRELHAPASISFEHALFLLLALARHDEVDIARCDRCGGVQVRDLLARHRLVCGNCDGAAALPT